MAHGIDLSGLDRFKASSLLAEPCGSAETVADGGAPLQVRVALIDFDPLQPRRTIDPAALAELASSIAEHGVLEPVSLRRHPQQPGRYVVNRGERRVRASTLAGRDAVPAFLDERIDPYAQAIENLQREDLSPFDLARFVAERELQGDSRAEIARRLHKPKSFITEIARLADAPDALRSAFDRGRVRDTRVLYRLARGLQQQRPAVEPLLAGETPITREGLDSVLDRVAPSAEPSPDAAQVAPVPGRTIRATRQADALLVEHAGRRGRLGWAGWPGRRTGEVRFDDGSRQVLELAELKLIAWTAR